MTLRHAIAAALLAASLLVSACATRGTGDYAAARDSWHGARYEDVLAQWGAPVRSSTLENGSAVHTWVSESSRGRSAGSPTIGFGVFGGGGGSGVGIGAGFPVGGSAGLVRCERNVVVREGRIVEQTWNGEPDYCASFGRR